MSALLKTILLAPSGGAFKIEVRKEANIFGIGQVCSVVPAKEIVAIASSSYAISVSEVRLVASPPDAGITIYVIQSQQLIPSPTSSYSLSTAPT